MNIQTNYPRAAAALALFEQGYNCAQAVIGAFSEELGLDPAVAFKLSMPFGKGVSGSHQICGAVSSMTMGLGLKFGFAEPVDGTTKNELYRRAKSAVDLFRDEHGTINCPELLQTLKDPQSAQLPSAIATAHMPNKRCARFVYAAAKILEDALRQED